MKQEMTVLPNGLRVLTQRVESVESVALGAYFCVGTRHEDMSENGVAHLVEHMMFKGTKTRKAKDIYEQIEGVGGEMNAYTSREVTGYYFHLLKEHATRGVDVLADMLQHSTVDPEELERERQVIIQEIGMENDSPDDLVFDYYQQTAYPGQTIGAPVLGTAKIVEKMPREAIKAYVNRLYTPANMVISAAGNLDHDTFVKQVEGCFNSLPSGEAATAAPAQYAGGTFRKEKKTEQAHVVLGFRGIGRTDSRYYDAVALAYILGGGMSSRLFLEIREQRGLAYNVYAFHASHADDGQFGIYAGTGPDRLEEYMEATVAELRRFTTTLDEKEVARTRTQLKSTLLMGRESMVTCADQNAKFQLFHKRLLSLEELRSRIDAISVESVRAIAEQIFAEVPTLAALGPIKKLPAYDDVRARLAA